MQNKENPFNQIAKEIAETFVNIFASRPYIAILDEKANIHYIDDSKLIEYKDYFKNYIKENFNLLNVGDHSFPLPKNFGCFKLSPKVLIIIYTEKGPRGQLLAFKAQMNKWSKKIANIIEKGRKKSSVNQNKTKVEKTIRGFIDVPILKRKLSGKEKFPIKVAQILQFCDGKHSIEAIQEETKFPKIIVKNTINEYIKKKWIEMKRVLI